MRFSSIALFLLLSHSISGNEAKQTARSVLRRQRSLAIERKVPVLRRRRSLVIERKVSVQRRRRRQDRTESPSADLSKAPSDRTESPSDTPPKATSDRTEIVDDMKVKKVYRGCDDYYHNRDVESGDTRHWENKGHVSIDIFSPGYNSNYALKTVYRDVYWASMMQEIDTSCLNIGMKYTLSSMIRLKVTETGDNWKCNKDIVWGVVWQLWEACPVMTLQYWNGNQTSYQDIGRFEEDFKANEWNELKGDFIASNEIANADKVIVFWNKVQKNYTIIMDDFSIKPSEDLGCNKLIWNGDAEDGNPGYWHSHGSGRVVMHTPGGSGSSYAVKAVDRQSPDDGLTHTIDIDCLTPGAVYKIEAEIRLLRGTRSVGCDSLTTDDFGSPARCPHLSLYTKTDGVEQSRFVAAIAARWRGRQWNKLTGYFTFMANELEGGMVYIVINKGRPDADIVVDNLSLETVDLINEVEAYHHTVES
mmetsp:Transcript_23890/g.29068  ORF Transcript_23890/g.29068 Transcript_23890/m.29068 type:complete len:475 (+) Transcript_23890:143-1567(+)